MDNGAKFVVVLHQVWKKHPLHRDFLGFYMADSHRLSEQTHGLLGNRKILFCGIFFSTAFLSQGIWSSDMA